MLQYCYICFTPLAGKKHLLYNRTHDCWSNILPLYHLFVKKNFSATFNIVGKRLAYHKCLLQDAPADDLIFTLHSDVGLRYRSGLWWANSTMLIMGADMAPA